MINHEKFLFLESRNYDVWVNFWTESLKVTVDFLKSKGVHEYKDLVKLNARALVEPALWRLPEINGKYHTRFYSREVWERTIKEGKLPSKTGGKWNSSRAEVMLEHVVERSPLIQWIFEDPNRIDNLHNICIGCVVTKNESSKLHSKCGVDPNNVWKRYLDAKVDVFDRMKNRWHILDGKLQ
jgi:hypothetical protein